MSQSTTRGRQSGCLVTAKPRFLAMVFAGLLFVLVAPAAPARGDAVRDAEWHLAFLDLARVYQISQGNGVTVGLIDSGINGNHPDLAGNVLPGMGLLPGHADNGWEDLDAHGTAMAGLIAAHGHAGGGGVLGIAPKAKIFPILTISGRDHGSPELDAAAINAAVQQGARVISMSIGRSESSALREAVARAQRADVVIVAAVGNRPDENDVTFPARYDGVVAVAAVDRNGNHADFSVAGRQVLIAAPGLDIKSSDTGNGYGTGSGTSDATAITAGVVALIRAKFPTLPAAEVIHRLTATATDKGPKGRDDEYGYGIVNPYAALTADVPPLAASASPSATPTQASSKQAPASGSRAGPVIAAALGTAAVLVTILIVVTRRRATT